MKLSTYILTFLFINILIVSSSVGQEITESDGLRLPGDWIWENYNGMGGVFDLTKETTGTIRWHTKFQFGGTTGANEFKFASGNADPWANEWEENISVNLNTIETFTFNSGGNNNNRINITNGNWYTVNWQDQGYVNTNAIFMETSAEPVTLDNLTYSPSDGAVEPWNPVTVTITTSATPCAEEKVFLRYTTDGYTSSTLLEVSFTGSTGTADIPAFDANTTVSFYAYSTTLSSGDIGSNHDIVSINYINNSGSNYGYTVNNPDTYSSVQPGVFNSSTTWGGSVPPAEKQLVINHDIVMDVDYAASSLTINSGAELSFSGTETLTIRGNGAWTNNGNFAAGNGNLVFENDVSVGGSNNSVFNNVVVSGVNVDFDNPVTDINGVLKITTGSILNAPEFLAGSTLQYEQGGGYNRVTEWNNPYNVVVANNTALNLKIDDFGGDLTVLGDLTINSGSSVSMDGSGVAEYDLIINGNLDISGTLTLGPNFGYDMQLKGNWSRTGTFNSNTRSVSLVGTTDQSISGQTSFDYLIVDKSSGNVSLNDDVEVSGVLTFTNGLLNGNGNAITVSDNATTAIVGASSSSYIVGSLVRGIKQLTKGVKSSKGEVYLFPIGTATSYNPAAVDFTTLPSVAGTITATFNTTLDPNYESDLPMTDGAQTIDHLADGGYWELIPATIADYTYDLTIQGSDFVDDPAFEIGNADGLRLLIRDDFTSSWQFLGTHGIGTASPPSVSRAGITDAMGIVAMGGLFSENPLPVDLSYFKAKHTETGVMLIWETLSETENDYFEIYRSNNSSDFEQIAVIDGAGNSLETIRYKYVDDNPYFGFNYYYVKQVDFNGKHASSEIVAIENTISIFGMNRINDKIFLQTGKVNSESLYYQFFDLRGMVLSQGILNNSDQKSVIDIPKGYDQILMLRVYSKTGLNIVQKIPMIIKK